MANNSTRSRNGRYAYGGYTSYIGDRLGWWDQVIFPQSHTDISIIVSNRYKGRPDLIAYDVYGDPSLQWVVLQYNNIIDVVSELEEGNVVTLPSRRRLLGELLVKVQNPSTL